ncbi:DUF1876 domain-containing protein [Jiangella rhizosphaerae]|uniref:DUF1876 domain-containing protein n=1 Tax=Jiangella rhizosphaerae TaxID=2293569 RepID=A0A418KL38_9ACTN|nr:DUF1876 domain-containing protein [Jiangella rhizosphaerae]RIQ18239.1 DUF1876 domain-containing protein [Jiangella rhizosphaerae]
MAAIKHWTVDIYIGEHDDGSTYAEARLITHATAGLRATGTARLNPSDVNVPEIGDELATARALRVLADELLGTASDDIENITHEPVHLKR